MSSITTLIPAYKTEYLAQLFVGLGNQRFRDFRVVLSDDSPDGAVTELIRARGLDRLGLELLLVRGPREGSMKNIQHLLDGWGDSSALVHIHLDDDLIYPGFYLAHADAHAAGTFGASVSLRWVTREDGRPAGELPLPGFLRADPRRVVPVSAEQLFASTVPFCENWLGELSNAVLSQEGARRYRDATMEGLGYYGLGDIGCLLDVSRAAPIAVIRDHLGVFRINPEQSSSNLQSLLGRCGFLAWVAIALAAWRDRRVATPLALQAIEIALANAQRQYPGDPQVREVAGMLLEFRGDLGALLARFAPFWSALLDAGTDSRRKPAPRAAALA